MLDEVAAAERAEAQPLVVDQLAQDAGALPVGQDLRRDVQRVRIRMPVVGDVIRDDHRRQRPRFLHDGALLLRHRRLLRDVARHRPRRLRHAAEVLVDQLQRLRRVEVADDRHGGVFRHVVGAVEVAHVLDRRRFEIRHAADRRMLVRMHQERVVVDDFREPAVRLVLDAHPALFLDDLALAPERRVVDAQRRHAIGLEPQHQRQVVRRQRLPEDRLVLGRVGVAAAADARDERRVRLGLHVPASP